MLEALFRFDFMAFSRFAEDLDPAEPGYGQIVDAALRLALELRRGAGAGAVPEAAGDVVDDLLSRLGEGGTDLDRELAVRVIGDALSGGAATTVGSEDAAQIAALFAYRLVADAGLDEDGQRALVARAAASR